MLESIIEFAKNNQQVAGALTLVIGGSISYMARSIPQAVLEFVRSQSVSRIEVDNFDYWDGAENYNAVREWYLKNGPTWLSRSMRYEKDGRHTIGSGRHYFIYKGVLCWMETVSFESSGVSFNKERLIISCFSRNTQILKDFIEEATAKPEVEITDIDIFVTEGRNRSSLMSWSKITSIPINTEMAPLVNEKAYEEIISCLKRFSDDKEWFKKNNAPYKRCFMFYGPPGTGKTTLATQIASITARNIYRLDMAYLDANQLDSLIGSIKPGSIMLLEDIHSNDALLNEEYRECFDSSRPRLNANNSPDLSKFLNVLSGVVPLNDVIVIMTTNYLERLDPAVYRPGRVDLCVCVDYLDSKTIYNWLVKQFGERATQYKDARFKDDITTGEVFRLYELYRTDLDSIVKALVVDLEFEKSLNSFRGLNKPKEELIRN